MQWSREEPHLVFIKGYLQQGLPACNLRISEKLFLSCCCTGMCLSHSFPARYRVTMCIIDFDSMLSEME